MLLKTDILSYFQVHSNSERNFTYAIAVVIIARAMYSIWPLFVLGGIPKEARILVEIIEGIFASQIRDIVVLIL